MAKGGGRRLKLFTELEIGHNTGSQVAGSTPWKLRELTRHGLARIDVNTAASHSRPTRSR